MPHLKRCPVCDNFPQIDYDRFFLTSAQVYCSYCGRHTDWYDAFWTSDASHKARVAWNNNNVVEDNKKDN